MSPRTLIKVSSVNVLTLGNKSARISSEKNTPGCSATMGNKDENNKQNDH